MQSDRRPWHEGEIAAQRLAGARMLAPTIRTSMTEQLRQFFSELPYVFLGGVDGDGFPSATLLCGAPGFIACATPTRMDIRARFLPGDPLEPRLSPGAEVGLLGVDFRTRRRNRVNGRVASRDVGRLSITLDEAFGNCARYIHERAIFAPLSCDGPSLWEEIDGLDDAAIGAIAAADTFFVASAASVERGGVDISHRGGPRGFAALADGAITVPDFNGNGYFNTLGNLLSNPRAGLLFPDVDTGEALRLAGPVEIIWEGAEVSAYPGAKRLWRLTPCRAWRLRR